MHATTFPSQITSPDAQPGRSPFNSGACTGRLNNLLTVIKCPTEMMSGELEAGDPIRIGVDEIARAANRGAALTQQLLAFSRKQLLRPRMVALSRVVTEGPPGPGTSCRNGGGGRRDER